MNFAYFLISFALLLNNISSAQIRQPAFSIAALTWNIGNKTAQDKIVKGFCNEIGKLGSPDVIVVATQEELAKNGEE